MRQRSPERAAAEGVRSRVLIDRSGRRCEAWVRVISGIDVNREPVMAWERCRAAGTDAAHVFRRWKCGKARDLPEVVIYACRQCHNVLDAHVPGMVRIPLELAQEAWDAIMATNPHETASLGDRPTAENWNGCAR